MQYDFKWYKARVDSLLSSPDLVHCSSECPSFELKYKCGDGVKCKNDVQLCKIIVAHLTVEAEMKKNRGVA